MSEVIPADSSRLEGGTCSDDAEYSSISSFDGDSVAEDTSPVQQPGRQIGQLYTKEIHPCRDSASVHSSVDVVHVFTTLMEGVPADSGDIFKQIETEWREYEYQIDFNHLLLGTFTESSLQRNAYALLDGLNQARQGDSQHRLIILVAYEFGGLLVKQTLYEASRSLAKYSSLFDSTIQVIFSNCLQRSNDRHLMRMAVLETLRSYNVKPLSKDWRNPSQVQLEGLTRCIFRTSEAFLGSKFTVQSQTISIYPSEPEELKIQSAYMFTLGLFSETTVRRDGSPSTHLWPASVVTLVQDCLTSDRGDSECRSLFKVMRHLSACERQLRQYPAFPEGVTSEFHAILASPSCQRWQKMETTQGRPLLLHGQSYSQLLNIANCIIEHQRSDMERGRYGTKVKRQVLAFEFDSADPARNSIHGMVSSLIAQLVKLPELMDSMAYETLHANYTLGGGWTLESLFNLLEASDFYGRHGIFLIHRLDHCEPLSCSKFLEHYMSASSRYEHRRRIIVTTQNSESVSNQKFPWISIGVDDAVPPATQHWDALADSLAQAYPFKEEREQVREALSRIALVKEERQVALQIIQLHTSWPEDTSRECLAKFIEFSKVCHPMDTSATILGKILRDLADPELVQWVVMWLDRPCRPLYRQELMTILSESVRVNLPSSDLSLKPLTETRRMTRSLLRILVEPDMERLILRPQIRQMLATLCSEKSAPTWYEVEKKAHEMITVFTQHFLTLAPVRENLKNELEEYNASNLDSGLRYQAPLCPEGLGVEFKLLESLPYHLLHSQPTQPTALLDNILWTRAYWAITNPFTRGPCPTETFQMKLPEFATMIACQPNDIVSIRRARYLASSPSDLMGAFRRSMLASDQDNAVFFASEVSKLSHAPGAKNAWLRQSLWAAALQGMPDVVEVLLMNNGLDLNRCSDLNDSNDDDTDSSVTTMRVLRKHWTSPIAVAIYFGHFEVVELLLRHESRLHVHVGEASLRRVVGAAVPFGHTKVLQKVLHTAPGLLDSPDELQYLLHRAAACGSIGILPEILNIIPHKSLCLGSGAVPEEQKHEANPIEKKPLYETESPLYAACASRWPGVTSILLERNATPEQCSETSEIAKALWCSMEEFPSLECVEQLLRHGADPNENLNLDEMPAFIEHIHRSLEYPEESPSEEFLVEMLDAFLMGPKGLRVNASSKQTGNTALTTASWFCSRAVVEWLLEHGAEVDAVDEQGLSALHYAVARNHVTIVRALLDRTSTSQLDAIAKGGDAAILAHAYASPEITDMLLDRGVDVNAQDGNGCTALYCAVLNGLDSEDIVRKLLARGADTAIRVKDGWSPLATAVSNGVTPIVRLLVDAGASPEDVVAGHNLVILAARHVEVLRIILEFHNRVNVNHKDDDGWTPLMWAASWEEPQEGSAEHLRLLLRAGADTKAQDSDGQTVLHKAARAGVASNMAVLLACPDIDVNQTSRGRWGSTPLTVACDWGHLQVAEMLLVHSADVNVSCLANFRYPTALISACSCNRFSRDVDGDRADDLVRALIARGANVEAEFPGCAFSTALSASSLGAGLSTLKYIMELSPLAHFGPDHVGRRPIHYAAANGIENLEAVYSRDKEGLWTADLGGKTALHWAAQFGNAKALAFILSEGEKARPMSTTVDQPDGDGWTPLCWALRRCSPALAPGMRSEPADYVGVVKMLLSKGANPQWMCRLGRGKEDGDEELTAIDIARRYGSDDEIIQLLENKLDLPRAPPRSERDEASEDVRANCEQEAADQNDVPVVASVQPSRKYKSHDFWCDVCYMYISGLIFKCTVCENFGFCAKCVRGCTVFHDALYKTPEDQAKTHEIIVREDYDEYEQEGNSSTTSSIIEPPSSVSDSEDDASPHDDGDTSDNNSLASSEST